MGHETSQYDISNYQLPAANGQPAVCRWTEIGEPKITYTISGRARVRQISEQGNNYRAWLLAMLAVTAIAAVAWLEWIEPQLSEQSQSEISPTPSIARVRITAPAYQPEYTPLPAAAPPEASKPETPMQPEINNPATNRMSAPQQPSGLKPNAQVAANPAPVQSSKIGNSQPVPPATNNSSLKNQTGMQQLPKLSAPLKPAAQIAAVHPAAQPEPPSPAAVATRAEPSIKEAAPAAPAPSPEGGNQPSGTVTAQQ